MKPIITLIIACLLYAIATGQNQLSLDEIVTLKKNGATDKELLSKIEESKANFYMNRQYERELIIADISDAIIDAIRANPPKNIELTNISDGDSVTSHKIYVTGTSPNLEGRYLWFFIHTKDLVNMWWPQGNAVSLDPSTNTFSTTLSLGLPSDVGSWFEIGVVWLEKSEHDKIMKYILDQNSLEKPTWPPMALPTGTPKTIIKVFKKGH